MVVRVPDSLRAEREHAVRLVFDTLLGYACRISFEARSDIAVTLEGSHGPVLRMPDVLFASAADWPRGAARPADSLERFSAPWASVVQCRVPVLFGRKSANGRWWEPTADGAYLGVDLPGTAFWMMTRLEELLDPTRDPHDRFPARASHCLRAGYLDRPIVDETTALLAIALQHLWPGMVPRADRYATVLTHDVDRPFKHLFQSPAQLLRSMAGDLLRRGDLPGVLAAPSRWVRVRRGPDEADPFFTFEWLMDQSERAGLSSAFYFICGHSAGRLDGDYGIRHPRIRKLLRRIHARGHELGVHGSYNSFRCAQTLRGEFEALRSVCAEEGISQARWGVRQHVLRFDCARTPAVWEAAGFAYDATLGYADSAGFRCGTCHPFPLFDHAARRTLKVMERPLVAMDVTLMSPEYEGLGPDAAAERIEALRGACRRENGEFVLLWHNCQLTVPGWRELYARVVKESACQN